MTEIAAVLEAIGARTIFVEDLGMDALVLLKWDIVLVDADLDDERLDRVVEHVIDAAIERQR
jgi:hypothetical protein